MIEIFNLEGQDVYLQKCCEDAPGLISSNRLLSLPAGVYVLRIEDKNGIITKRFLKQ